MAEALTPWIIRQAYSQGIFPMTLENGEIGWFSDNLGRALFPMSGVRVSRSFAKTLRKVGSTYRVTFDQAFEQVMRGCLRPDGNWISETFIQVYTEIHRQGWGHSCEVWRGDKLVGGLYGIAMGSCFCAESMFHRETDCSKIALWAMVNQCRELGFHLFDAQIMNPHLESMGAFIMDHEEYLECLMVALRYSTVWSG